MQFYSSKGLFLLWWVRIFLNSFLDSTYFLFLHPVEYKMNILMSVPPAALPWWRASYSAVEKIHTASSDTRCVKKKKPQQMTQQTLEAIMMVNNEEVETKQRT